MSERMKSTHWMRRRRKRRCFSRGGIENMDMGGKKNCDHNLTHTFFTKFKKKSNHCDIWSCEQVCLTTTPAGCLTYKSDKFLILGCFSRELRAIPFPIVRSKTQFETQLVSHSAPCFLFTQLGCNFKLCICFHWTLHTFIFQTETTRQTPR